jgi:hypothetical protein
MSNDLKEADRMLKELSKEVGGVSNRLGEVARYFFGSDLWKHFASGTDKAVSARPVYGAAALMADRDAKDLADELGMYVIEQSGGGARLAKRPE